MHKVCRGVRRRTGRTCIWGWRPRACGRNIAVRAPGAPVWRRIAWVARGVGGWQSAPGSCGRLAISVASSWTPFRRVGRLGHSPCVREDENGGGSSVRSMEGACGHRKQLIVGTGYSPQHGRPRRLETRDTPRCGSVRALREEGPRVRGSGGFPRYRWCVACARMMRNRWCGDRRPLTGVIRPVD